MRADHRTRRRSLARLTAVAAVLVASIAMSSQAAQAKDAFCTNIPGFKKTFNSLGKADFSNIKESAAVFTKAAKAMRALEPKTPPAIKGEWTILRKGFDRMQASLDRAQKSKEFSKVIATEMTAQFRHRRHTFLDRLADFFVGDVVADANDHSSILVPNRGGSEMR